MNVDYGQWFSQIIAAVGDRQDLWPAAADGVLKATIVLVVALVLDVVLRRWAVTCVTMWNATLVGLLALAVAEAALPKTDALRRLLPSMAVPVDTENQASVTTSLDALAMQAAPEAAVELPPATNTFVLSSPPSATIPTASLPSVAEERNVVVAAPSQPSYAEAPIAVEATAPSVSFTTWLNPVTAVLAAIVVYFVGWSIAAWRLAAGLWAVAKLRRSSVPPSDDDWHQRLAKWADKLELRRTIELSVSGAVNVPLVVGAWRPMIVVPSDVAEQADGPSRDAVLVHELTHVARCDYAWQLLFRCLQTILWFHPLVWVAERRINFVRERVCDAFSVHGLGSVEQYADALLEMAGRLAKRCSLSLGLAVVRSSKLGERLAAIHEYGGSGWYVASRGGRAFAAFAALGIAALLGHTALAQVFTPRGARTVDEASAMIEELEAEVAAIARQAEMQIEARRSTAITVLLALQDEYSKAAKLDEAVAIRDRIRMLRNTPPKGLATANDEALDAIQKEREQAVMNQARLRELYDPNTAALNTATLNGVTLPATGTLTLNALTTSTGEFQLAPPHVAAEGVPGFQNINLFGRPVTSVWELRKIMDESGVFTDSRRAVAERLFADLVSMFDVYERLKMAYGPQHPRMIEVQIKLLELAGTIYGLCEYGSTDDATVPTWSMREFERRFGGADIELLRDAQGIEKQMMAEYLNGKASLQEVITAKANIINAAFALCKTNDERAAVLDSMLADGKQLEAAVLERLRTNKAAPQDAPLVYAFLLDARNESAKLKGELPRRDAEPKVPKSR